ncbi:FBA [Lepeophtheirus salmonis]|uniref:fructose-bisphosphate aldolase n=1 Tax=Lepeophtheirus salmonis TaxID=72036 RepID=A0A7R8D4S1_LEPSM|nr:FBA [Lepeophtheirus salmonis]CAF3028650.1 FBA [Lepeophtheirus salmonis]
MYLVRIVPPGVITGDNLIKLFEYCRDHKVALPAFNCTSSSTINAVLQAARDIKSPVIVQFSNGGAAFMAGKGIKNDGQKASVLGAIAGAQHVRLMAKHYGVPVVLHSDHCAKKLLPWFDGMLEADEEYFKQNGEPLFSSHMLDLSEEFDEENISTSESLYTKPEQVYNVYTKHSAKLDQCFPLLPLLETYMVYTRQEQINSPLDKPAFLVMHGGSGSTREEIAEAVSNGVIKMNIDTDTQWAYWDGLRKFYEEKKEYLQGQVGNPEGADKPNKKFYDPRVWVRAAEESMIKRANESFESLNAVNVLGDSWKH